MPTPTTPPARPGYALPVDPYEQTIDAMPWRAYMEDSTLRELAGDLVGATVVDLGCGLGTFTRRMRDWGAALAIGVDISSQMIARAREIERAELRGGLEYLVADLTGPCDCEAQGYGHLVGRIDLVMAAYLLSYAATRADLTAMCRHAATDLRPGGRLLAVVLHPDVCVEPGWYDRYGFSLTAEEPVAEGGLVRITAPPGPVGPATLTVDAVRWTAQTYENSLRQAGFTGPVTWHPYVLSQEGSTRHGAQFWSNYLARPHVCVVQATR